MKTTSDDIISASWTDRLSDCNILFRLQSHPFTIQRRFIWGCCWMSVRKTNEEQGKAAFNLAAAAAAAAPPFSSHFPLCSSFYFISIFVCQTTRSSVFTICDALHTHNAPQFVYISTFVKGLPPLLLYKTKTNPLLNEENILRRATNLLAFSPETILTDSRPLPLLVTMTITMS